MWIIFFLSCQFYVCICVYTHMLLSQVYLDLLSGQTVRKLHLATPFKAIQNREYKTFLPFEIQVGIPIFLFPLFKFFHCHMCTYKLFSPLLTGPVVCAWILTLEVTLKQTRGIFFFMEQMHWQFISYSWSLPSGIHSYKLKRCIGYLTISCACLSDGPRNHGCIPVYTVIIATCFLRKRMATVP